MLGFSACAAPPQRFINAAKKGDLARMEQLRSEYSIPLDTRDNTGATALHWACLEGWTNVVQALLEEGLDPDIRETETGYTPLHMAAWKGHNLSVRLLLKHGARVDIRDNVYGNTPLFWANAYGQYSTVALLVTNGADITLTNRLGYNVMHVAAREKYTPLIQYYLSLGMPAETVHAGSGLTPVMIAAHQGHVPVMRLLLTNGADPLRTNKQGLSAVDMGLATKRSFMVKYIKDMISNGTIVMP